MTPYTHIVRYYECDRMGITHHSNYIRFMEEARIDWMDQLGYGYERMEQQGIVSPVTAISCQYKHATTFKDAILISLTVAELTALKITFNYTMRVGDTVVCTASSTHCFLHNGRPVPIQQQFPDFYQAILALQQ
ncbi:MAG: acyl-CoA thioesterase [Paludibacteraceae bacterium]|nr:acyl-CoA thioesterase [Paludibacteraceae bacterium]